jgi:hypothetical protein
MKNFILGFSFLIGLVYLKEWNVDSMIEYAKKKLSWGFDDHGIFNPDDLITYNESKLIEKELNSFAKNFYIFPYIYIVNKLEINDYSDESLYKFIDSFINKLIKNTAIHNKDYTLIILLVTEKEKLFIYIGDKLSKKILKENCLQIINSFSKDIKEKKYGKVLQYALYNVADFYEESLFLDDIEDKKSKRGKDIEKDDEIINDNNTIDDKKNKNNQNQNYYFILFIIIGFLLILLALTIFFCLKLAKKLRKISSSQVDYQVLNKI